MNCPLLLRFQQSDADLHHVRICSVLWTAELFPHLINISLIKSSLLLLPKALALARAQTYLGEHFQLGFQRPGWSSIPRPPHHLRCPRPYRLQVRLQPRPEFLPLPPSAFSISGGCAGAGPCDGHCHAVRMGRRLVMFLSASWSQPSPRSILAQPFALGRALSFWCLCPGGAFICF